MKKYRNCIKIMAIILATVIGSVTYSYAQNQAVTINPSGKIINTATNISYTGKLSVNGGISTGTNSVPLTDITGIIQPQALVRPNNSNQTTNAATTWFIGGYMTNGTPIWVLGTTNTP